MENERIYANYKSGRLLLEIIADLGIGGVCSFVHVKCRWNREGTGNHCCSIAPGFFCKSMQGTAGTNQDKADHQPEQLPRPLHTTAPTARNSSIIPESWFPVFGASVWMQFALLHLKDLLYLYGCFWIILQNKSEFDIKSKFIHFIQWQPDGIVSTSLQITLSPYGLSVGLLAGNRSCIPSAWYSELRISSKYVSYKDWKALVRSWIYCSVSKDSSSLHSETKSS